jgi:hypothetical protein
MKTSFKPSLLLILAGLFISSISAYAIDDEQTQRIQASYLLAFGRKATSDTRWGGELENLKKLGNLTLKQLMERHKATIASGNQVAVIERAYIDAFGRKPSVMKNGVPGELEYWVKQNRTYTELMTAHMNWLTTNSGERDATIRRAFIFVRGTGPDQEELDAWKKKGIKSYVMLVGLLQHAKSKAGTKKLMGLWEDILSTASNALSYFAIGRNIQNEIATLIGNDAGSLVAAGGGNLVAAGGGNIKADVSLIGNDGASLVAAGGGNLVAAGGGN